MPPNQRTPARSNNSSIAGYRSQRIQPIPTANDLLIAARDAINLEHEGHKAQMNMYCHLCVTGLGLAGIIIGLISALWCGDVTHGFVWGALGMAVICAGCEHKTPMWLFVGIAGVFFFGNKEFLELIGKILSRGK